MKEIIIYGSGGLGRGVAHLIEIINDSYNKWNLLGFLDDNYDNEEQIINGYPLLGDRNKLGDLDLNTSIVVAIANPIIKKDIVRDLKKRGFNFFPNIIHPSVEVSRYNELGVGNIISKGVVFSTNIEIKDFCLIHFNSSIGHDAKIESFCTIHPQNSISGYTEIKKYTSIGTNSSILPNITVGNSSIVGAGSVVTKNIEPSITVIGSPAKEISESRK